MPIAFVRIAIAATLFVALFPNPSASQCPGRAKISADQELERLQRPLNRDDRIAVACVVAYMDDLSRRRDPRVIPILIQNLDLELTPNEIISLLSPGLHVYGGKFPAMDDISWFTNDALPPLLNAIEDSTPETLLSQNATKTLMSLEADDPPAGIKLLVNRAAKEHGSKSQNLMDAATYAVSVWQCRNTVRACRDALKNNQ